MALVELNSRILSSGANLALKLLHIQKSEPVGVQWSEATSGIAYLASGLELIENRGVRDVVDFLIASLKKRIPHMNVVVEGLCYGDGDELLAIKVSDEAFPQVGEEVDSITGEAIRRYGRRMDSIAILVI